MSLLRKGKPSKRKGKMHEEIFGKEKSKEIKEKIRSTLLTKNSKKVE